MLEYREDSWITYNGDNRPVQVVSKEDDIKNGEPGFEGRYENGQRCWGYDSQIDSVLEF